MSVIKPFKGLRPRPELAKEVASRPYDVLNSEEAREEAAGNQYSFLHVCKPEIDLPEETDHYSQEVYDKGKENLAQMIREGILIQDETPCLYAYRQIMNGHAQVGLVANSGIDDYFNDIIKKHEFTRPEKENDRIRHMATLSCHPEPVFLTYPDVDEITPIMEAVVARKAVYDFTSEDGIQHTFWVIDDASEINVITEIFREKVPFTYIADGHHRSASSAKVGQQLREANPGHTGEEEFNFFLSVLFPSSQLMIMDYNRLVKDLNGHTPMDFFRMIAERFDIKHTGTEPYKPEVLHTFGLYYDGHWYQLTAKPGTYDDMDPIKCLDVTVLSDHLLDPVLGIKDQRTDKRIDFVGGIRGLHELEKRVDSGEMKLAISLFPVSIDQLIHIADSGNVMPPKSTWFEPKLRSGLIVHAF
ncbi:MAG: DUF1015 domain-containing protein [Chitinophagales bacterium]|nr:DUF1015 domain-containing protein [Chitinophagales bacterium]HAE14856.1 DUF1015 domain-containing protein [Bacteroidota bacterium]HQU39298.1 DUF1015 family protein [Chitinophagales bacterium]HRX24254.1 DUF1015 family protein [Chitinophagales bacterium]